jgi:hypothetical protein
MAPAILSHCRQVTRGTEDPPEGLASQARLDLLADGDDDAAHGVSAMSNLPTWSGLTYCSYLDRINVAQARLAGLQDDLGMSDEMWGLGISAFYIGMSHFFI